MAVAQQRAGRCSRPCGRDRPSRAASARPSPSLPPTDRPSTVIRVYESAAITTRGATTWPTRSATAPPGRRSAVTTRRFATFTCASCSRRTPIASSGSRSRPADIHADLSKHRVTAETLALLLALADERGVAAATRRDVPGRARQLDRGSPRPPHRSASSTRPLARRRRPRCRPRRPRGARPDAGVLGPGPVGRVARSHGAADPRGREHRHRRLGSRAGDGVLGAPRVQRPRHHLPLRVERRRSGLPRGGPRSRSADDAGDRLLEDVHDRRDDDERQRASRSGSSTGSAATRRRSRSTSSPCRPTSTPSPPSGSIPPTPSASGTGSAAGTRWTLRSGSRR